MTYKPFSEFEHKINQLIQGAIPSDDRLDFSPEEIDQIKGGIVQHLLENKGNISDSTVRGIARVDHPPSPWSFDN